jgi:hypothetical protein
MATPGTVQTYLAGLPTDTKKVLQQVFDLVLRNGRLGRPGHQMPTENIGRVFIEGTTDAVADTEFSILHGLETAPYLAVPVLDLQTVNSRIVPLTVTQAADARRVYLSSSEESAAFTLLVE